MKRTPIVFLQAVVVLVGIFALVFMLGEPHFEGRNIDATFYQIYFNDWFLVYAYTASIAFFTVVYQAFKVLGNIGQNKAFSFDSVQRLKTVRYCAFVLIGFVAAAVAYLMIIRPEDDIAGGVAMGLMIIFISVTVAAVAAVLEKVLQSGVDLK